MKVLLEVDIPDGYSIKDTRFKVEVFHKKTLTYINENVIVLNNTLKTGNKDYIVYKRDYLFKNLDREIKLLQESKKYYDANIETEEWHTRNGTILMPKGLFDAIYESEEE